MPTIKKQQENKNSSDTLPPTNEEGTKHQQDQHNKQNQTKQVDSHVKNKTDTSKGQVQEDAVEESKEALKDSPETQNTQNKDDIQETQEEAVIPVPIDIDLSAIYQERVTQLETANKLINQENDSQKQTALRALAELENFKKRKQQEVDTFKKFAAENVILELLPVLDSFDLACEHANTSADKATRDVVNGFELIQKQFHSALEKVGVTAIEALNQPFNPEYHQAIAQEESKGVDADIIIKEMQRGYRLHDRVIRPSMVVVSK